MLTRRRSSNECGGDRHETCQTKRPQTRLDLPPLPQSTMRHRDQWWTRLTRRDALSVHHRASHILAQQAPGGGQGQPRVVKRDAWATHRLRLAERHNVWEKLAFVDTDDVVRFHTGCHVCKLSGRCGCHLNAIVRRHAVLRVPARVSQRMHG